MTAGSIHDARISVACRWGILLICEAAWQTRATRNVAVPTVPRENSIRTSDCSSPQDEASCAPTASKVESRDRTHPIRMWAWAPRSKECVYIISVDGSSYVDHQNQDILVKTVVPWNSVCAS